MGRCSVGLMANAQPGWHTHEHAKLRPRLERTCTHTLSHMPTWEESMD